MPITGGEAIVRCLAAQEVNTVFGIPGAHNLSLYDALCDISGIRHIVARHEQGAAFMADGYARASGRVGVCLSTSGPAALNTLTSLATAYSDSAPVLCVASQIPAAGIGLGKGYLHECTDQLGCFRPVTKWCARANTVSEIPGVMHDAFTHMLTGRQRPTAIEVPCDIMESQEDVNFPDVVQTFRPQPTASAIHQAVELLRNASRPVIWAGGGVISSEAGDELEQLAVRMDAPIFTTVLGKGCIAGDHPLSAGAAILHPAAQEYLAGCDTMLAVGTRFTEEEVDRWKLRLPTPLIHIDVDPAEIGRNYPAAVGVVGDAQESLRTMNEHLAQQKSFADVGQSKRAAEVTALRQAILDDSRQRAPAGVELVETLQSALPRETILVSDLTVAAYWCRRMLDVYEPRTNIYPWGFCTLGFGVPAAVGAKAARPDRPVVVLSGDGGFLFNCQELATAVQFDLPIIVLVFNDGGYGVLRRQQEVLYGRTLGADLVNPDFVALAQAFGVESRLVTSFGQLGSAVSAAVDCGRTSVIEVQMQLPWMTMEPSAALFADTVVK